MRWILFVAAVAATALLASPMSAAPPDTADATTGAAEQTISFAQYRDWRLHFIEQRQAQLTAQLAAANLTATQRSRLEQQKAGVGLHAVGQPIVDLAPKIVASRRRPLLHCRDPFLPSFLPGREWA
jgi:hypothetical protein